MKNCVLKTMILLLFLGCSGNPIKEPSGTDVSLENTFDLSEDKLEKMTIVEPVPSERPAESVAVVQTPRKLSQREKKIEKNPKKSVSSTIKKEDAIVSEKLGEHKALPEDYPKQYIEYDKKSKKYWEMFKPSLRKGEKLTIRVKYSIFPVGDAEIESMGVEKLFNQDVIHYQVRIKSADYYSAIYSLNDVLDSYISLKTYTPLKYSLIQRETKQEVDDLQIFSLKDLKTHFWYRRLKLKDNYEKKKKKEAYIPRYFLDLFSGFFFIRGLPLDELKVVEFPVVSRAEVSIMQLSFIGVETIEIMDKKIKAWKVKAEAKLHDGLKKKGDIIFWYSADDDHRILKFEGKVKIGSITGELVKYESGEL